MANRITPLAMTMMMNDDRDDIKSPKEEMRKKEDNGLSVV